MEACSLRLRGGTGKAKPKKHTAAELAAKAKAANESVGGGKAGIAERDKNAKLTTECLEPGCAGTKLTSLTVCSASFIYLFRPVFRDFFLALFLHVLTSHFSLVCVCRDPLVQQALHVQARAQPGDGLLRVLPGREVRAALPKVPRDRQDPPQPGRNPILQ